MTQNHYFQAYAWPGNVRELKQTVECMAVIAEQDALNIGDLPEHLTNTTGNAANVLLQLPEDGVRSGARDFAAVVGKTRWQSNPCGTVSEHHPQRVDLPQAEIRSGFGGNTGRKRQR